MIHPRPCVNGILAAVLSASILPIHGALAREKAPAAHKAAKKHAVKKPAPAEAPKAEPAPDTGGGGAGAPMVQ
ncbi:hypothetical protein LG047_09910 [Methylocystis sp. WRRC1]|uniref:hypothetical protein n=1 Tax=unclassified Methylocystis TaxID=2625913 RepID=UPI0001F86E97|nr:MULTISPECIES: hypothetical protein [unclassified Methylocystis]MCC3245634.1 hypothetical protein [Methylocystis sp. WRRC1]